MALVVLGWSKAFDAYADEPEFARQATSSSLAIFTISVAIACTLGGIIYDASGWQGMAILHTSCQGCLVLILLIYPTCRESFKEFFGFSVPIEDEEAPKAAGGMTAVVPTDQASGQSRPCFLQCF